MATAPPPPRSSEPVSVSSSTRGDFTPRPRPTGTSEGTVTVTPHTREINTVSLHVDPSYTVTSSTSAPTTTETSAISETSGSSSSPSRAVTIVIITFVAAAFIILAGLFICLYKRRRKAPRPKPQPNVLRRPESHRRRRRPSEFWSADASKPPSALSASASPRSPTEHAGLLAQAQAMRETQRGSIIISGPLEIPSVRGGLYPMVQQPTPTHYPEPVVWDRTTDVEQQNSQPPLSVVQPRISESYFYPYEADQASVRSSTSTIHSRSLLSPLPTDEPAYSSSNLEQEQRPASSSHYSSSLPSSRHQSSDPFALDNLILGSPTSPPLSRNLSQLSAQSSIEPRPSLSIFPLPPTRQQTLQSPDSVIQSPQLPEPALPSQSPRPPQPVLQPDISQALASLRRPGSRASYLQRNPSSASTTASRRLTRNQPSSFAAGYFMYAPNQNERPNLSRAVSEAPSLESVYSVPDGPPPHPSGSTSRNDLGSSPEAEIDGVRYSREDGSSSPALPDSVRTSILSFFERKR